MHHPKIYVEKVNKLFLYSILLVISFILKKLNILAIATALGSIIFTLHWNTKPKPKNGILRIADISILFVNIFVYFYYLFIFKSYIGLVIFFIALMFYKIAFIKNDYKTHISAMVMSQLCGIMIIIYKK